MNKYQELINSWVKEISIKNPGGNIFFDKIDSKIKSNTFIIKNLFDRIISDFGINYNLVVSGEFGNIILQLIKKNEIVCNGSILLVSGGLTSHFNDMDKIKKIKDVHIQKKIGKIENMEFIFVDDSYYSGTTEFSINKFLNNIGSKIIKTYVVYDGNDKKTKFRKSIYNYYDWNVGSNRSVDDLLNELERYNNLPKDIFRKEIISGNIKSIIQLRKEINKFLIKSGEPTIDVYKRIRESIKIKRFSEINI
jgi:hypothetical protein